MSKAIWERSHYTARISYLIGTTIREYDISKANISVLRDAGAITEDEYQFYLSIPKQMREVSIGKMRGENPELTTIINSGVENARKEFIERNQLSDSEILRIANDSITVIGNKPITYTDISDRVHFRLDGYYTSFYRFGNIEILYYYDIVSNNESIAIKGINDSMCKLHEEYMIDLLKEIFCTAQVEGPLSTITLIGGVYGAYVNKQMPIGYYREFNSNSMYRLKGISEFATYYMDSPTDYDMPLIDISYNGELLRHFYSIYASMYFKK